MRTTLVIEDDVLEAARSLAKVEGKSLGQVISKLALRQGRGDNQFSDALGTNNFVYEFVEIYNDK